MRGSTVKVGEYYTAQYYDIIPKVNDDGEIVYINGKMQTTIDTVPYTFSYKEPQEKLKMAPFSGFKSSMTTIGIYQTEQRAYNIYTTDVNVPFKVGGKVVLKINGKNITLMVNKIKLQTNYANTIANLHTSSFNYDYIPLGLELI